LKELTVQQQESRPLQT